MKIATITFHWATNYGAVLQAYALQTFLKRKYNETEIIQYLPRQNMLIQRLSWIRDRKIENFKKEKVIRRFRKQYFNLSPRKYGSNAALRDIQGLYDVVVCGSDQVWNFSFLEYAEWNKVTASYYLNFVAESTKRIAYAVSFGTNRIPEKYENDIKKELVKFTSIGVREHTAQNMLSEIGIESRTVLDPTLLLVAEDYEQLLERADVQKKYDFFAFILHNNQHMAEQCREYLVRTRKDFDSVYGQEILSVEEWLYNEKNAKFILTNSFHSTVFAILFHTPFIVVPVEGSDMDDRIVTLLQTVNLEQFFLKEYSEKEIDRLMMEDINWDEVDHKLAMARVDSQDFLLNSVEKG